MANDNKTKYLMYMHAGSGNHGCEAIVRGLCSESNASVTLLSHKAEEDKKYGLSDICDVLQTQAVEEHFLPHLFFYALKKLTGHGEGKMAYKYKAAQPFGGYDYAISIGGDNYCYDDTIYDLRMANAMFNAQRVKTALIGCSIEPELMERQDIVEDMSKYSVIVARESITYRALINKLEDAGRVHLVPDPAFGLKKREITLPEGFESGKVIGINVSPLILGYEQKSNPGITLKNYEKLIDTILADTTDKIALIPHVVWDGNDDREPLRKLYDKFSASGRIILVEDHSAEELKYIISKCRLFIGARTHATIAAYSTCVPTLVVGYSVKSRGIAVDLFATEKNYVIPVQNLEKETDLADNYKWLENNADFIRDHLASVMPDYIKRSQMTMSLLEQ